MNYSTNQPIGDNRGTNPRLKRVLAGTTALTLKMVEQHLQYHNNDERPGPLLTSNSLPIYYSYTQNSTIHVEMATFRKIFWNSRGIFSGSFVTATAHGTVRRESYQKLTSYEFIVRLRPSGSTITAILVSFGFGIYQATLGNGAGALFIVTSIIFTLVYVLVTVGDYNRLIELIDQRLFP